jgi:hypothetical protein
MVKEVFSISVSLAKQFSPYIAGHCVMIKKMVKERLVDAINN